MTYFLAIINDKQLLFNWINVVIIVSIAIRLFLCEYKRSRDSWVGTALIILCVWEIYDLLNEQATAGLSSIASNIFLGALVFAAKGNVMQVFKRAKNDTR